MIGMIGALLLVLGMMSYFVTKFIDPDELPFKVPKKVSFATSLAGGTLVAFYLLIGGLFFHADAGYVYFVQYNMPLPGLNGVQVVHTTPGYHLRFTAMSCR